MDAINASKDLGEFLRALDERFAPSEVILFGSRARGDQRTWSDYDIIVVSQKFEGIRWLDRRVQLLRLWNLDVDADLIPYTPEELKQKSETSSIIRSAMKEGKRIRLD
jgi:predicted nucleotidyltransferase